MLEVATRAPGSPPSDKVHPEFDANVEQIHLTTVDKPSEVDVVQFNFVR